MPSNTRTTINSGKFISAAIGLNNVKIAVISTPQPNINFPPKTSAKRPPGTWVKT